MTEAQKELLYSEYLGDGMKKLKQIVLPLIRRYCSDANLHWDDFLSACNYGFRGIVESYDETKCDNFYAWAVDCFKRKIKTELTKINNSAAVTASTQTVPLDAETDESVNIRETVGVNDSVDHVLDRYELSEPVYEYVKSFQGIQRKIVELIMEGFSIDEIRVALNLSRRELNDAMDVIRSVKHTQILYGNDLEQNNQEENEMSEYGFNRRRLANYTITSIKKKIQTKHLLLDYVLQREEGQWTVEAKSNFIAAILQQDFIDPLMISQKVMQNGSIAEYLTDGKQRLGTTISFSNNSWKIGNKVLRPIVKYETNPHIDPKTGEQLFDWKEFDIRGKKFRDLPLELQDIFWDTEIPFLVRLNCTDEDIQYDMLRRNAAKVMNSNQKAVLKIGYTYATRVKKITSMEFFTDGKYKTSEEQKGALEKICVESIMASNYLDDWKKNTEANAEYLANNASQEDFDDLEESADRLNDVVTDETKDLFKVKDAYIWFSVFHKFKDLDEDDVRFNDFMIAFKNELHSKEINGVSYDTYAEMRNTKDKKIVSEKIELIYALLVEFLSNNSAEAPIENVTSDTEVIPAENNIMNAPIGDRPEDQVYHPMEMKKPETNPEPVVVQEPIQGQIVEEKDTSDSLNDWLSAFDDPEEDFNGTEEKQDGRDQYQPESTEEAPDSAVDEYYAPHRELEDLSGLFD